MEHPNITLKIEIEDKSTSDIELVDSINNNELIDSYSKLYSTNIHKEEFTDLNDQNEELTIRSNSQLLSTSTAGIKSEPNSPSSSRKSFSSSGYTPVFNYTSEFTNASDSFRDANSPQPYLGDLDWLHSFKLPMSLSDTLLYNNFEYTDIKYEQSQYLPCSTNQNYLSSFKFEHNIKPKKPRTKYTKEDISCLEEAYDLNQYPNITIIDKLCNSLGIPKEKIMIWFQNRRARDKRSLQQKFRQECPISSISYNPIYESYFPYQFNFQQTTDLPLYDQGFQASSGSYDMF